MKVLAIGWELPQQSPASRLEAANYRTWQLVEALRKDGHQLLLAAGRIGDEFPAGPLPAYEAARLTATPIRFSRPDWAHRVQQLHDDFLPDCIVGITFLGALRATRLRTDAPLWGDLYGDPLAEMQAATYRRGSDRGVATQIQFMRRLLQTADTFSTCSRAQRHALIGQLAMVGRLSRSTFGYEFAHVVPAGVAPSLAEPGPPVLRGSIVDHTSKVVLWCGGYNTWTDVETLFRGLELALAADPQLHFVSVGGAAAGSDAYARFTDLIAGSRHAVRYHLLGWQPVAQVPSYYREADFGISLDATCYEAELGTRTRLAEMMRYGLPIVTTQVCELSQTIQDKQLGFTCAIGDWQALGWRILAMSRDDEQRRQSGERARRYVAANLSLEATTAPLRSWAQRPRHAPDRQPETSSQVFSFEHGLRAFGRQVLWSVAGLDR